MNRLSASYLQRVEELALQMAEDYIDRLIEGLTSDGHLFGTVRVTPVEELAAMEEAFARQDPALMANPDLLRRLEQLRQRYGQRMVDWGALLGMR